MELSDIKRVYLLGIGGIGMSGLARYFHHLGCVVCGYDKTSTDLTNELHKEGIPVIFDDREEWIPLSFQSPDAGTLIIYTPAIPKDSAILNFFRNKGFELFKRSQVLGIISKGMFTVAYDTAIRGYGYLVSKGREQPYYIPAKIELINTKNLRVT